MWIVHPLDVELRAGRFFVGDVELPASSVIHLRGLEPIVDGRGSGVLSRFAAQLGYTQSLRTYAAGIFYSGVPAGYLKVTKDGLAQDKADELKARWLAAHGGNQRSIAVLNSTTEFHPLTFSPVDAELVAVMAANLNELANAFGIPGYLLGAPTDNNTYANVESRRIDLATFTYLPWTARIEAVLDAQFPRGVSMKVGLDGLLRADSKARAETLTLYVEKGVMTVDEARAKLDLPPMPVEEAIA
jgi:HK97 family phage portal protein